MPLHLATSQSASGVGLAAYVSLAAVALGWVLGQLGEIVRNRRSQSHEHRQAANDLQRLTCLELQDKLGDLWNCVRAISRSLGPRTRWDRDDVPDVTAEQFADLMMRLRVLGTRIRNEGLRIEVLAYLDRIRTSVWEASAPPNLEQLFEEHRELLNQLGNACISLLL